MSIRWSTLIGRSHYTCVRPRPFLCLFFFSDLSGGFVANLGVLSEVQFVTSQRDDFQNCFHKQAKVRQQVCWQRHTLYRLQLYLSYIVMTKWMLPWFYSPHNLLITTQWVYKSPETQMLNSRTLHFTWQSQNSSRLTSSSLTFHYITLLGSVLLV